MQNELTIEKLELKLNEIKKYKNKIQNKYNQINKESFAKLDDCDKKEIIKNNNNEFNNYLKWAQTKENIKYDLKKQICLINTIKNEIKQIKYKNFIEKKRKRNKKI